MIMAGRPAPLFDHKECVAKMIYIICERFLVLQRESILIDNSCVDVDNLCLYKYKYETFSPIRIF